MIDFCVLVIFFFWRTIQKNFYLYNHKLSLSINKWNKFYFRINQTGIFYFFCFISLYTAFLSIVAKNCMHYFALRNKKKNSERDLISLHLRTCFFFKLPTLDFSLVIEKYHNLSWLWIIRLHSVPQKNEIIERREWNFYKVRLSNYASQTLNWLHIPFSSRKFVRMYPEREVKNLRDI